MQRTKGRGKGERRLGDLVFKMAESARADDYAMFQSEFRPVHSAYLEKKIACPDPLCKEKPVFCQKMVSNIIIGVATLRFVSFRKLKKLPSSE